MSDQLLEDLAKAIDAAGATFNGRGSEIKERELEMALETALWARGRESHRQFRVRLEKAWSGRVGGVDLAIDLEEGPALIELKWDPKTLAACAWDAVKLAAALHAGEAQCAFLIAGSPVSDGFHGNELLETADFDPIDLRHRYARDFEYWKGDVKNHPLLLPRCWHLELKHGAALEFKGAPWHIRLAELELTSDDLVSFE
jgi:hypothetical protein